MTLMLTGCPATAAPASGLTRRKRLETRSRNALNPLLGSPLPFLAFKFAMLLDLGKEIGIGLFRLKKKNNISFKAIWIPA